MKRIIKVVLITLFINGAIFGGEIFSPGNASFSGIVKNDDSLPLENCRVYAYDSLGNVAAFMETDSTGYYIISGIASGRYKAKTVNQQGYIDVWYINGNSWEEATPFNITDNDTLTGINFNLTYGGCIEGSVKNSLSSPISNVYVDVYDTLQNFVNSAVSDSAGNYFVGGLRSGKYKLCTENYSGYINEWYNNKSSFENADIVNVYQGDTTSGILFQLDAGGCIEGYVKSDSGNPIVGVTVSLYDLNHSLYKNAQTDSNGFYIISSVESGGYKLGTYNNFGYVDKYYNNKFSFESADTLNVNGDTLSDIDFNLIYTGIKFSKNKKNEKIRLFYFNGKLYVNALPGGIKNIELFDISGAVKMEKKGTDNQMSLNLNSLKNGVYLIKIKYSEGVIKRKIIYIK